MTARELYTKIPIPLLRLGFSVVPYSWIVGKQYKTILGLSKSLEYATKQEIFNFQEKQLRKILQYAVQHIPFYRNLPKCRTALEHYKFSTDAIREFPFLTKELLQEHFSELLSDEFQQIPHTSVHTGGSSGNQLYFFHDNRMFATELAFIDTLWQRCGYEHQQKKATFRGVCFRKLKPGVFWQYNPVYNELQFSPFDMNEENLPKYLERILQYRPQHLHGYPSALYQLADFVIRHGTAINFIRTAFCGSEPLYDWQREKIETAFHCKTYSWYGHSERVILAGECERSTAYHALPAYGYMECLNTSDTPVEIEQTGELIGTGFWNRCMPLIRYRTGDFAVYRGNTCACGRNHEMFDHVDGRRNTNYVLTKNGVALSAAALNEHSSVFEHVRKFQYYQKQPGSMQIRVVPSQKFSEQDQIRILESHKKRIGKELDISIVIMDDIPLTNSGKFLSVLIEHKKI